MFRRARIPVRRSIGITVAALLGCLALPAVGTPGPAAFAETQSETVALKVDRSLVRDAERFLSDDCRPGPPKEFPEFVVGWSQFENDGDPCHASVFQTAVHFNRTVLDQGPPKNIDRAILAYGEGALPGCATPGTSSTVCWKNGEGDFEQKLDGCVAVLGIPTIDWINFEAPPGLVPHRFEPDPGPGGFTDPRPVKIAPQEWDVTSIYRRHHEASVNNAQSDYRYGFLLAGSLSLDRLEAEDNTNCLSQLTNLELRITYTTAGGEPPVVR